MTIYQNGPLEDMGTIPWGERCPRGAIRVSGRTDLVNGTLVNCYFREMVELSEGFNTTAGELRSCTSNTDFKPKLVLTRVMTSASR